MKKKFLTMLLVALMALSLVACGGDDADETVAPDTTDDAGDEDEAEDDDETDAPKESIKVGMVTDVGGVNDGSFNESSWEGLLKAQDELGIEVKYLESANDADYAPNIEAFVDEEYDLIISVGYMLADATRDAAEANPDQKFAIIDDSSIDLPNVTCLMFEQGQSSYLVGVVAGMMTETNKVGFVLGMENAMMNEFGYGYVAGVLDTNPDAEVLQINANSFGDPAIGKSSAVNMITEGADIIFHAAGGTGRGVIDACVENDVYAIGVDSDQSPLAPEHIITSAMKRVDVATYDVSKDVLEGTLEAGIRVYDMTTGGVDIAPTTDLLTDEVIAKVEEVKQQILDGEVEVPKTQEEFEAAHGDAYVLDAEEE